MKKIKQVRIKTIDERVLGILLVAVFMPCLLFSTALAQLDETITKQEAYEIGIERPEVDLAVRCPGVPDSPYWKDSGQFPARSIL